MRENNSAYSTFQPAYQIYIEKFGSWQKCLSLAGVLDDGHRKTSRGIQCLANDGHLCLSLGEKAVDDWLSIHNVIHDKEYFYPFDEQLNPNELPRGKPRGIKSLTSVDARQAAGYSTRNRINFLELTGKWEMSLLSTLT